MGLFSSKKKTIISSQVYNLAGDKREKFIKSVIFNGVYLEENPQLGYTIIKGITGTPAFKLRRLISWLKKRKKGKRYQEIIGHYFVEFNSQIGTSGSVLEQEFINTLTIPEHYNIKIDHIEISGADYWFWGAKYLAENYPQYADETAYDLLMDFSYKNNKTITIHVYDLAQPNPNYPTEDNEFLEVDTILYQAEDYEKGVKGLYAAYQIYPLVKVRLPGSQEITWEEPEEITVPMTYFIYKNVTPSHPDYNSIYAAFFNVPVSPSDKSTFILPPIPFRLDNWQVSDAQKSNQSDWELYQLSKLANKKAFNDNKQYDEMSKNIVENESIGDLDFVYLVFGVSINTKDKAGKQYIFNFMQALYRRYLEGLSEMYVTDREGRSRFSYKLTWSSLAHGYAHKGVDEDFSWMKKAFVESDKYTVVVHSRQEIDFVSYNETNTPTVYYKKKKHVFFLKRKSKNSKIIEYYDAVDLTHHNYVADGKSVKTDADDAFDYEKAEDGTEIYKESGFIFPIHEGLFRQLPVMVQAQISQSYAYLVFNCYQVKKIKWYQRGIFKIIVMVVIVIIIVVVTILTWGSGTAPTTGMAGAVYGGLVGAGMSATAALVMTAIVKAVVSMVVATVVAKLTTKGLVALGLDKTIAAIAGTVAGIIAGSAAGGAFDPGSTTSSTATITETATETVINSSSVEVANTALQGATNAITNSVYSIMTSPIKLLGLTADLFKTGTEAYYQQEAEKLQSRQKEIEKLQTQTELLQQELSDMQSQFSEWAKKLTLWKLQTNTSPEVFFEMTLASGSDYVDRVLRYPSIYLDVSTQLS